ncbi:MAG: glutamate racemase [Chitinophagaceae bacterium]|nr:MAG: glutamate racemase [Chitinophagaceae bacterium]
MVIEKSAYQPIGIFDSGYGGLTVFRAIVEELPPYDYLYLGDNARTPYGNRSFETVYHYTLQCVRYLFQRGCRLVILACNTASAKALRGIQQRDLPEIDPARRVLGVIRPSAEVIGQYTQTGSAGILATNGTVASQSYPIETGHFYPDLKVYQQACPMWVPLVENHEFDKPGADYFIRENLAQLFAQSSEIDTILLGCTHYPLLMDKIRQYAPAGCTILSQGEIVAKSLADYLHRHPEMERNCSKNGSRTFLTTDDSALFDRQAKIFLGNPVISAQVDL